MIGIGGIGAAVGSGSGPAGASLTKGIQTYKRTLAYSLPNGSLNLLEDPQNYDEVIIGQRIATVAPAGSAFVIEPGFSKIRVRSALFVETNARVFADVKINGNLVALGRANGQTAAVDTLLDVQADDEIQITWTQFSGSTALIYDPAAAANFTSAHFIQIEGYE